MQFLRMGSTGDGVRRLQDLLNYLAFPGGQSLQVDGIFGSKTRARVVQFQQAMNLDADGIVGPMTATALSRTVLAYAMNSMHRDYLRQPQRRALASTSGF